MPFENRAGSALSVQQLLQRLCASLLPTKDHEALHKACRKAYDALIFPYELPECQSDQSRTCPSIDTVAFSLCCHGEQAKAERLGLLAAVFRARPVSFGSTGAFILREHVAVLKFLLLLASDAPESSATVFLSSCMQSNPENQQHSTPVRNNHAKSEELFHDGESPVDSFALYASKDFCVVSCRGRNKPLPDSKCRPSNTRKTTG